MHLKKYRKMFLNDDDSHYYGQQAQSQEKLLLKCFPDVL